MTDDFWWLRPDNDRRTCSIYHHDDVHDVLGETLLMRNGLRPVLVLDFQHSNLNFNIGDKFKFGSHLFTIISKNLAICDDFLCECCFRENWRSIDANIYEKSDIKNIIDTWFDGLISEKICSEEDWGF